MSINSLVDRLKKIRFSSLKGVEPNIPNPKNSDIYLVSYPKSGNTWMRYLLAYAIWPHKEVLDLRDMASLIPSYGIQYDDEMMLRDDSPCNQLKHRVIKQHFSYNNPASKFAKKIIYICRDGRDAIVSYWHFCNQRDDTDIPLVDFIKDSAEHGYGPWRRHVVGWLEAPVKEKLIIRYEDMLQDPELYLFNVLKFIDIYRDANQVTAAVEKASFGSMKSIEQTKGFALDQLKKVNFVRKGKAGEWQNEFTSNELEVFIKYHGRGISKLDYIW